MSFVKSESVPLEEMLSLELNRKVENHFGKQKDQASGTIRKFHQKNSLRPLTLLPLHT